MRAYRARRAGCHHVLGVRLAVSLEVANTCGISVYTESYHFLGNPLTRSIKMAPDMTGAQIRQIVMEKNQKI